MDESFDPFAGLPFLEWAETLVRVTHPNSVPFGPLPVSYVAVQASKLVTQ